MSPPYDEGDRVSDIEMANRLDRPVNAAYDHVLGPDNAEITLVEYGSYDCPHCRAANERISQVRDQFGNRLRYVFRHRPITGSSLSGCRSRSAGCRTVRSVRRLH